MTLLAPPLPSLAIQAPAVYHATIEHIRRQPLLNRFRYRTRMWLVDLDELPKLPRGLRWLARFDAGDHLGDPSQTLRTNVGRFLSTHGLDLDGGRVLMLANARAWGHGFNPISIHWCFTRTGRLVAVIAEVHNTYGERHAYLLEEIDTVDTAHATLAKAMYVSPFNPVDGHYQIRVSPPGRRISVSVSLHREGSAPFVATLDARREAQRPTVVAASRAALTSWRVSTLIRWQGLSLWRRGLRVQPRPVHADQTPAQPEHVS